MAEPMLSNLMPCAHSFSINSVCKLGSPVVNCTRTTAKRRL